MCIGIWVEIVVSQLVSVWSVGLWVLDYLLAWFLGLMVPPGYLEGNTPSPGCPFGSHPRRTAASWVPAARTLAGASREGSRGR